jgi:hypothetical protein
MFDRKTIIAMLLVYLLISFMPSLSLMSLLGRAGGGGKKGPGQ